jgi:hypothetical protein
MGAKSLTLVMIMNRQVFRDRRSRCSTEDIQQVSEQSQPSRTDTIQQQQMKFSSRSGQDRCAPAKQLT